MYEHLVCARVPEVAAELDSILHQHVLHARPCMLPGQENESPK